MARPELRTHLKDKEERYSDFTMDFAVNPTSGNLAKLTDERAIAQALKNRILTNMGERPYNAMYGTKIKNSLFELSTPDVVDFIKSIVVNAVDQEYRVSLEDVNVIDDYTRNGLKINIFFKHINSSDIYKIDLFLKRVR
jgi:phage baseplate assembly protein W